MILQYLVNGCLFATTILLTKGNVTCTVKVGGGHTLFLFVVIVCQCQLNKCDEMCSVFLCEAAFHS